MLKEAEVDENAEQTVLNEASETLQVLAAYTVAESQIESLVTAKGYADCVAFMGEDSISVVVSAPEGLQAADVARIKDIVIQETDYTAPQIKIMEAYFDTPCIAHSIVLSAIMLIIPFCPKKYNH